jgi:hypothetical protein
MTSHGRRRLPPVAQTTPAPLESTAQSAPAVKPPRPLRPPTRAAKRRSRWNALRHGLLCREVVIRHGEGREDPRLLTALIAALRADFQPADVIEEMLVEKIAVSYWKSRRALRAEVGEIRRYLDTATMRETALWMRQFQPSADPASDSSSYVASAAMRSIQAEIFFLDDLRAALTREVPLSLASAHELLQRVPSASCYGLVLDATRLAPLADPSDLAAPNPALVEFLHRLDAAQDVLRHAEEAAAQQSTMELVLSLGASSASHNLPERETADKIRRYENSLDRQFFRALHELERRQRRRLGEFVPAPVEITINGAK